MTEIDTFKTIIDLIQSFGIWIVFFWLYYNEKRAHEETRQQYRNDLREVAGFHANTTRIPIPITEQPNQ